MTPQPSPQPPRPARASALHAPASIRSKLLAMVLLPLVGVLPLLALLMLWWGSEGIDRLLRTKVRSDLAVAQGYFERVRSEVGASTGTVAESAALQRSLLQPAAAADLVPLLQRLAQRERLDFIHLHAPDGRLLATESGTAPQSAAVPPSRLAERTGVEVLPGEELAWLPATLRQRVPVPLLPTRSAAPTAQTVEARAMVLLANRAVRGTDGRLLGHLRGGVLLNRNLALIDHINGIVYPEGSLPLSAWGSRGTVTLFLDDVRISTNVRLFGGEAQERAIGTRVSQTVRDAVLGRGVTWLDRAFVVDEWYVSGYEPLADGAGRRIGMLYVGILEQPFTRMKYAALASIGAVFVLVMLVAAVVSLRWARAIFRPLERIEATMREVEGGVMEARVGPVPNADEIGHLAQHLDHLLEVVEGHTRELQRWNAELDAKVAQRTLALEERTHALQAAQEQLVRSEKLATVGQLTASIAHEVNNPIAVIQGNLDLMRELLGPAGQARVAPELRLVDEQIERMRLIVTQLLQFARPTEYAGYVEAVDTARALDDGLVLVNHLLARTGIRVQRDARATRSVAINRQELQQVLVNLLVNAIHAMGSGGTLALAARDAGANEVEISVADSGPGLSAAVLQQLFQPFVSGKKDGTGLGLWISRGIVERYGGDILAANGPRGGAVFTVRLKAGTA
jgi:signal transduction histidine kinase